MSIHYLSLAIPQKHRRAHSRALSRGQVSRSRFAAVESLERRLCLSVSFSGPLDWPTGDGPVEVAVGDFNGDGKQDLATANDTGANVSILLGNGSGGFSAPTNFGVGANATAVAVGDFNGDSNQDLAVTVDTVALSGVTVLLGNGSGGFASLATFPAGAGPRSVAVADFDGDGNQDLAVANFSSNNVSVLLGEGDGSFGAATNFTAGDGPISVAVGNFNGDGHAEIAVANYNNASITVLINGGGANFSTVNFNNGFGPVSVAVGDLNGDGNDDLVTSNDVDIEPADVSVLLGDGTGSFAEPQHFLGGVFIVSVAVADFDLDGNQDVAAAELFVGLKVLLGDGSGNLASPVDFPTTFGGPQSVTVGDFNGDHRPDLAVANGDNDRVGVLLNTTIATPELANVAVTSSVLENGIATLSGDINHSVAGHSFTLLVDWGDGSTPEEFTYAAGTTDFTETHQYLDDDPSGTPSDPVVIGLTLTDDAGGSTTGSANLTVVNVAPDATLTAGGSAVRGVPLAFNGGFTDVGTLDTHEVEWDFGDGTVIAFHPTTDPGALTPSHVYSASGTYLVTMTVRDDDTGMNSVTTSVFASVVGLVPDPSDATRNILVVGGTAGDDDIRFSRVQQTSTIDAFIGSQYLGRFSPVARLAVFAGAGNDTVTVANNISLPAILLGGDGDDTLTGGNGRDILIGGAGADRVSGGGDDDILIGGTTAHDDNLLALGSILNEWTRSTSVASRVNNLQTGGGLSAGFALNTSTVFDDGAVDVLMGQSGKDWFLFGTGDVLTDLSKTDKATFS